MSDLRPLKPGTLKRKIRRPDADKNTLTRAAHLPDVQISAGQLKRLFGGKDAAKPKAQRGDTVTIHYAGRRNDGSLFDTSRSNGPIRVTIGAGTFIAAFEHALIGMRPGTRRQVTIPAHHAYGPYRDELVYTVDRSDVPSTADLHVGSRLGGRDAEGRDIQVRISAIEGDQITLDANHPLAGEDLTFDIQMLRVVKRS